jgi:outer membrane biosynthesis protein TonB
MEKAEMHAFEKAMMDDPMLSDAVDGYREAMDKTNTADDLVSIKQQLSNSKTKVVKGSFRQWMRIAAGLIILLSGSVVVYRIFNQKEAASIAKQEITKPDTSAAPAVTQVDSTTVAVTEIKPSVTTVTDEPKPVVIPPAATVKVKEPASELKLSEQEAQTNLLAKEEVKPAEQKPAITPAKDNAALKQEAVSKIAKNDDSYLKLNRFNGKIVDENNNPLPFANITEKNTGVGTYADVNGNFVLLSADSILTVQTKSIGYISSTAQIKTSGTQKIMMRDEPAIANAPSAGALYERNKNRANRYAADTTAEELVAEPYDGWQNYEVYVSNNRRSPFTEERLQKNRQTLNEVTLSFEVNPDGSLTNIKVEQSNCGRCNNEAIRLLKEGPRWKSKSGKKEHSKFTVRF